MKHQNSQKPYLELVNIDKFFGVTKAVQKVNLQLYEGEVIGLVGANGAGKSTLIKVITGVLTQTDGQIYIQGELKDKYTTKDAIDIGISCAYQDLSLCENLKVYENFAMLSANHSFIGEAGWRQKAKQETKDLLEEYFPANNIDVTKSVELLTLAEKQIVEICKAIMVSNLKILILDEPTSALSTDRANQLLSVVKKLGEQGVTVIYISHKLDEIKRISTRIVLLKNGKISGEFNPNEVTTSEIVKLLGGESRKKDKTKEDESKKNIETYVEISNLNTRNLHNINMYVNKGEILGISGLVGSGQTELLNEIFEKGHKKTLKNEEVNISGSVSYVSGDRAKEGVFPLWSIQDNINISSLNSIVKGGFLDKAESDNLAQYWYDKLKFKANGIKSPIMSLSGGNQQKALIARSLAAESDIIILNDPTAGVDIETKQEIYNLLNEAKLEGKAIILYSTEDAEIEICDRAYIMRDGEITQELVGEDIIESNIISASFKEVIKENKEDSKEKSSRFSLLKSNRAIFPFIIMIAMLAINGYLNPNILTYKGLEMLIGSAVPLVFAALGQMFIVTSSDIDMGNGYSIGLVNILIAVVLSQNTLLGIGSLVIFILAYALMGALIHVKKLPSIIITLGAQFVWLGIALIISPTPGGESPTWLSTIYKWDKLIIPMPIITTILAAIFVYYIIFKSQYGMIMRGTGNNPSAVTRAGWSTVFATMTNYAFAGLMVIFAGMSFTAVTLGADANSAASYNMLSIATVIIGGCELSGGYVEPFGVAFGAIAMSLITALLTSLKVDSNFQTAVTGLILILVLSIKLISSKRRG